MRSRFSSALPVAAVIVVIGLIAAGLAVAFTGDASKHLTAYFTETSGLYEGNDVRVLGVEVGTVTEIEPQATRVRVEMTYDADRKIPADAKAVIIQPTLLSGRYVQLIPVYRGGPVMPDGATLGTDRTASPAGFDQTVEALNQLAVALGPTGANKNGALSRLLEVAADNLSGQGDDLNRTIGALSRLTDTLASNRRNLFATVRQLEEFVTALAKADDTVEAFNRKLAEVSEQLAEDRQELAAALDSLARALGVVERFVQQNRDELAANVAGLADVTRAVVEKQEALAEILETAPLGLTNLALAYGPEAGALRVRLNAQQIQAPAMYLCSLAYSLGLPPQRCEPLLAPLRKLRMQHLPLGSDPSGLPLLGRAPPGPPGPLSALLTGGDQ